PALPRANAKRSIRRLPGSAPNDPARSSVYLPIGTTRSARRTEKRSTAVTIASRGDDRSSNAARVAVRPWILTARYSRPLKTRAAAAPSALHGEDAEMDTGPLVDMPRHK